MVKKREHWSSNWAFILAAAGSAVGLGNIWRFSYIVGQNGGGAFLVPYLIAVVVVGLPLMLLEIAIGRYYGGGIISSIRKIKGPRWLVGLAYVPVLVAFLIMSYYAVIMGWTLAYALGSLFGISIVWSTFSSSLYPLLFMVIVMLIVMVILGRGIKKGIEKTCMILMPLLFVFILALIVKALSLPGSYAGVQYYLSPDYSVLLNYKIWLIAIGQALFSLSLGEAILVTYGSYLGKKEDIGLASVIVTLADTGFALLAGLAIFPLIFAFGLDPAAGPELAFITLPKVFALLPFGGLFGALFFFGLFFGALTSALSLMEVVVTSMVDEYGVSRKKMIIGAGLLLMVIGIPSALSYNGYGLFVNGMPFLDFLDNVLGVILLPLGALATVVGFVWYNHRVKLLKEVNRRSKVCFGSYVVWLWTYLIPVVLIVLLGYLGWSVL